MSSWGVFADYDVPDRRRCMTTVEFRYDNTLDVRFSKLVITGTRGLMPLRIRSENR